jgi:hypothetical protein
VRQEFAERTDPRPKKNDTSRGSPPIEWGVPSRFALER